MQIVTYNIHHTANLLGDADYRYRILTTIQNAKADIVCLQEVMNPEHGSNLDHWSKVLSMEAVFDPCRDKDGSPFGNAILSSFPIEESLSFELPTALVSESRRLLGVKVRCNGKLILIWTTHLGLSPFDRVRQADFIAATDRKFRADTSILAGDLNIWNGMSRTARKLTSHFGEQDGCRTFPAKWPLFALDKILVPPENRAGSARAIMTPVTRELSDHLPLAAAIN